MNMSAKNEVEETKTFTAIFMALPEEKKLAVLHYMNGMTAQEAIDRGKENREKEKAYGI